MKRKRLCADRSTRVDLPRQKQSGVGMHAIPDVDLEDLCFDAQQAAEKAVKAVFIHRGESFPIHSRSSTDCCACWNGMASRFQST